MPFMECNHAVISMKNTLHGRVNVNESMLDFDGGTGYIEKDWGCSFPKTYLWCQGNAFNDSDVAFMFSAADIPFKPFSFQGLICVLMIGAIEYKFTTYNGARIEKWNVTENTADITVKRGKYRLNFKAKAEGEHCLIAPVRGEMSKEILETVSAKLTVTLTKGGEEVFCDTSQGCGLEMV